LAIGGRGVYVQVDPSTHLFSTTILIAVRS